MSAIGTWTTAEQLLEMPATERRELVRRRGDCEDACGSGSWRDGHASGGADGDACQAVPIGGSFRRADQLSDRA